MWLTVKDAALYLNVAPKTIRRRIKKGEWKTKEEQIGPGSPTTFIKLDEPKVDTSPEDKPKVDTPKVDTSKLDTFEENSKKSSKVDTLKKEISKLDISPKNQPKVDTPKVDTSKLDISKVDTPEKPIENQAISNPEPNPLALLPAEQEERSLFMEATEEERKIAFARQRIVDAFNTFRSERVRQGKSKAQANKAWDANNMILVPSELKILKLSNISSKSVMKWIKELKVSHSLNYPLALLPHSRTPKDSLPKEVMTRLRILCANPNEWRKLAIHRQLIKEFPKEYNISYRSACRLIQDLQKDPVTKVHGKESYKNKIKPHLKRLLDAETGQYAVSDGRTCDFFVYSPFPGHSINQLQKILRPVYVFFIDIATGLCLGYAASWGETTHLVCTAMKMMAMNWGIPERLYLDNGKSYQNYQMDPHYFYNKRKKNSDPWKKAKRIIASGDDGIYRKIGVKRITYSIPGNAESKTIEPLWNHLFEDMERKQVAFAGKTPDKRPEHMDGLTINNIIKEYGHLIPTWDEFIQMLNHRVNEWNTTPRDCLKDAFGKPMSPAQVYKAEANIVIPPKSLIDEVLNVPEEATVSRDSIYVQGTHYVHPLMLTYLGHKCQVKFDEFNLETAEVLTEKGERWAMPATRKVISSFVDEVQFQKALVQNKHLEKAEQAVYINARNEMPGKIDQRKLNKIATTTIEEADFKAHQTRELIKHKQTEKRPRLKTNTKLLTSEVNYDPENIDYLIEQDLASQNPTNTETQTKPKPQKESEPKLDLDFLGLGERS